MAHTLSYYRVNNNTMAVAYAPPFYNSALVLEVNGMLRIQKRPLEIIRDACIDYYSSFDGRREAVMCKTKYRRKVPIPINPDLGIYAFPTHALDDKACCWIFYHHVEKIKEGKYNGIVVFKNGMELEVETSTYVLKEQMRRTEDIILDYGGLSALHFRDEIIAEKQAVYRIKDK